jgi:hypothetical protein
MMRAQREAMEEIQAEGGGQIAPVDRFQIVTLAVQMSAAGMASLTPRQTPDEAADAMGLLFARAMAALQGSMLPPD